jgi:hypothetical protein
MSTINSSSTLAQVEAAYDDNASYVEDSDVAKCRAFITACRILRRKLPLESGTKEVHMRNADLAADIERAESWLNANAPGSTSAGNTGPRVTRSSFENFRC